MTDKEQHSNVIVVTSFNPGSGKSFLAMNIAVSLAIKQKKCWLSTVTCATVLPRPTSALRKPV